MSLEGAGATGEHPSPLHVAPLVVFYRLRVLLGSVPSCFGSLRYSRSSFPRSCCVPSFPCFGFVFCHLSPMFIPLLLLPLRFIFPFGFCFCDKFTHARTHAGPWRHLRELWRGQEHLSRNRCKRRFQGLRLRQGAKAVETGGVVIACMAVANCRKPLHLCFCCRGRSTSGFH